jgi:dihydroxyacetone kinase-like predicted kinase
MAQDGTAVGQADSNEYVQTHEAHHYELDACMVVTVRLTQQSQEHKSMMQTLGDSHAHLIQNAAKIGTLHVHRGCCRPCVCV